MHESSVLDKCDDKRSYRIIPNPTGTNQAAEMTIYEENRFILIADSPFEKRILFNWRGNISANERASERTTIQ